MCVYRIIIDWHMTLSRKHSPLKINRCLNSTNIDPTQMHHVQFWLSMLIEINSLRHQFDRLRQHYIGTAVRARLHYNSTYLRVLMSVVPLAALCWVAFKMYRFNPFSSLKLNGSIVDRQFSRLRDLWCSQIHWNIMVYRNRRNYITTQLNTSHALLYFIGLSFVVADFTRYVSLFRRSALIVTRNWDAWYPSPEPTTRTSWRRLARL